MTPAQNLWLTAWNFGPAIALGVLKVWWIGVLGFIATVILSLLLTLLFMEHVPASAMAAWAWTKPVLVGLLIFSGGWFLL